MEWSKQWTVMLGLEDIVDLQLRRRGRRVVAFAVNYRLFHRGAWHAAWRQDTAHGRLHCHEPGRPVRFLEARERRDYTDAFTQAEEHIMAHWQRYRGRWLERAGP